MTSSGSGMLRALFGSIAGGTMYVWTEMSPAPKRGASKIAAS